MVNRSQHADGARSVFWIAICVGFFLVGGIFAKQDLPPFPMLATGLGNTVQLVSQLVQTRPDMLLRQQYEGDGVTRYDPHRSQDGVTLMQGFFPDGVELRLVDMNGDILNRWLLDFFSIWPDPVHVAPARNIPAGRLNYHTAGMWMLPDASIVVNFSELGTAKLDRCGVVQWTIDRMTHHSVTATNDGSFWIPVKGDVRQIDDDLLLPGVTRDDLMDSNGWYEDLLLLVDSEGRAQEEFSVLEALLEGGFDRELFDALKISATDPTHVNDIEIVTDALARMIEGVETGDLLISIRQPHMLAILDRLTGQALWSQSGPWVRQHDPDITPDGNIDVFNNLASLTDVGSSIVRLNPATGNAATLYPQEGQPKFYTDIMGSHQMLENGNRLVTESRAGRVFEIDEHGEIVWEYVSQYDATHASLIESALRFDRDYIAMGDWSCPAA